MKIKELLQEYGLNTKEIEVYLALYGKEKSAYSISKEAKLSKSTTYYVLEKLTEKGFVFQINKPKNRRVFMTNEPKELLSKIRDKENILLSLSSELGKIKSPSSLNIRVLEGQDGLKQFHFNLLQLGKSKKITYIYTIGNAPASSLTGNISIERLLDEVKKKLVR